MATPSPDWDDPLYDAREKLKDLAIWCSCQLRGQISKTWTFRVRKNKQQVYPYTVPPDPKTPGQLACRSKFAQAVMAAQALDIDDRAYWEEIGVRKKEPLPWWNAFLSAYMKDLVYFKTMRHIRNLQTR